MSRGDLLIFVMVFGYSIICLAITIAAANKTKLSAKTSSGYMLADRSFGILITVCTVTMGIFSGLAFYGSPGQGMRVGSFGIAAAGLGIIGLAYVTIGHRLWYVGRLRGGYITATDFYRDRYYSENFGIYAGLMQLIFIVPYATVQFVTTSNGLSYNTGAPYWLCVIMFGAFVMIYLYVGGASGIGWMDIFNCLLALSIPVVTAFLVVKNAFGGSWYDMGTRVQTVFPTQNAMTYTAWGPPWKTALQWFAYMMVGVFFIVGSPHITSKMFMSKDKHTFYRMTYVGPIFYNILGLPITLISIVGMALYRDQLTGLRTDMIVPILTREWTSTVLVVLMLWVLFAFATSTANAFMLTATTIISNDFIKRYGMKDVVDPIEKDRRAVMVAKNACFVVVIGSIAVALLKITYIIDYAYNLATPGFSQLIIPMIFGLYWRRASREAAWAASICGTITLIWAQIINPSPFGFHPILWSGGVNIIVFYLVTIFTKPPQDVVDKFFPPGDIVI